MAKSKLSGALAFGAALTLLPVAAAASEHSEDQSEAQPQIITPEEFLEDVLGLIERYSQHGSGDDEAEGQWRHAPPLEEDAPEGQWRHAPPLEEDLPEGQWHHAPPLEDDDAPSEDDDSWHYDDDPWRPAPPFEDDDTPSEDDDSWHYDDAPWRPAPPLEDDESDMDRPVLI